MSDNRFGNQKATVDNSLYKDQMGLESYGKLFADMVINGEPQERNSALELDCGRTGHALVSGLRLPLKLDGENRFQSSCIFWKVLSGQSDFGNDQLRLSWVIGNLVMGVTVVDLKTCADKKPDLTFFRVFGALCYPTNDSKNLGKFQAKADIGIFVGYAPSRKGYRIYNKRTRRLMETIHVTFDEMHQSMASCTHKLGPSLLIVTPGQLKKGSLNGQELEMLFQPMFDEHLEQSRVDEPVPYATEINAQVVPPGTSLSTTIAQDAPSTSDSSSTSDIHLPVQHQEIAEEPIQEDTPIIHDVLHPSHNLVTGDPGSAQSSSGNVNAAEPNQVNYPPDHIRRWTKDHPLDTSWQSSVLYQPENEVFVSQLKGFAGTRKSYSVYRLKKALYGLKQAPKGAWYDTLSKFLLANNFFKGALHISDVDDGTRSFFLGLTFLNSSSEASLLPKRKYALENLKKYGKDLSALSIHNGAIGLKLDEVSWDSVDQTRFRGMVGSLIYQAKPTKKHFEAIKRVFRYLKGTINMGLWYPKDNAMSLTAYADADHAGCQDSRRKYDGRNNVPVLTSLLMEQNEQIVPPFSCAFTPQTNVPAIYLQQFWKTMSYNEKTGVYSCQVDKQWFELSADLLRKALAITPVNPTHLFELPPSGDTGNSILASTSADKKDFLAVTKPDTQSSAMLVGIITQTNVDHAEMDMGRGTVRQNVGQNDGNEVGQNAVQNLAIQNVENMNGLSIVSEIANQYRNGDVVTTPAEGNGNGINGNPIRCYNYRGEGHYASNCTVKPRKRDATYLQQQLQIAQEEEAGIQSTQEECEFMAADAYEETEKVKVNCSSEDSLQQASISGTQSDNAPVYDSDGSTEAPKDKNCYDNDIFNMLTHEVQYTDLQTELDQCKHDKISYDKSYNDMQQKIKWLQAQLGDLKGKSSDTQCVSNALDSVSPILEDENVSLEF
ncbi:retrovirus-related pol polyprotein from transposon TNT 1-94 [Tanacetum coccineum]